MGLVLVHVPSPTARAGPPSPQTMRRAYLRELTGPTTPEVLAAEAQSVRYWRFNGLGYHERVVDGGRPPPGHQPACASTACQQSAQPWCPTRAPGQGRWFCN